MSSITFTVVSWSPLPDGESSGQRYLTQAPDLQSQQERWRTVRVQGDASQLRGDCGVQSPSLAEGEHHSQAPAAPATPTQEELPAAPDGQEAKKGQLTSGPRQHEFWPEGGFHLQLSRKLKHRQTQSRLR